MLQASEIRVGDFTRRCVGKAAIQRSLQATLIRLHRFYRHRATSQEEVAWCSRSIDRLAAILRDEAPR